MSSFSESRSVGACHLLVAVLAVLISTAAQDPQRSGSSQSGAPASTAPAIIDAKAQTLLDKAIQALGGEAFLSSRTLTTRGRIFAVEEEATVGMAPFQSWVQFPDKRRLSYGKNKPVVLINDGNQGWELDQYGRVDQKPEQVRNWQLTTRYNLENLLRLRVHEPGTLVQDGGVDFIDNLPAHVIDIVDAQHTQVKLYLNTRNFRPIRITYRIRNAKTQDWDEYSDVYSDYQLFQSIQTPMHIARFLNEERVSETYRNSARYNDPYPPEYFQPVPVK